MLRPRLESDLADPAKVFTAAHHHGGLGVVNEIRDLRTLVGGIEWQKHITRPQGSQVQHDRFHRLLHLHRHARPFGDVERIEQIGKHGACAL